MQDINAFDSLSRSSIKTKTKKKLIKLNILKAHFPIKVESTESRKIT